MSCLQSLGISGIRGYTPQGFQKIEFMKPLTLIWGKNGSGKTTIIECLKYITTGSLPPNSDKGKSFIMDNKVAGRPQVIGDIRLIFKVGNRAILAKRRIQLSAKGQQTKFQSIEQVLKTKGENGEDLTINHQCAQIQKQVPQFLGISKPILENIVFCHQDESLWPFGDSLLLKNIFDQLFDTKKITKEMEKLWDIVKDQQTQLKQLKIRIEYQKQTFKKQIEERSKNFLELDQIEVKSQELQETKSLIQKLKQDLKDNGQKIKERQKLIYRKGRMENSIANLDTKLKGWKESFYKAQKQFESKMKGKNIDRNFEQNSYGFASRSNSIGSFGQSYMPIPSASQLQKIKFFEIQSPQKSLQELQFKKLLCKQLMQKYTLAKEQHQNLKNFTQNTKRQQQIKSEIERIKNLMPELKYNKEARNEEDFIRVMKEKYNEMEKKIQGKEMAKRKLERMQIPGFVEMGFSEKEVEELKKESKDLQSQIQSSSLTILKIYKSQYKPIAANASSSQTSSQLQSLQIQLQNTEAIIKSKQEQHDHYMRLQGQGQGQGKKSLQDMFNHYKYGGIDIQSQMLHFCEKKGKCYFCSKQMNKKQIEVARQKVNVVKMKAEQKLKEIENQMQNQQEYIDPQAMVKKLRQQIRKLQQRSQLLRAKVLKLQQLKSYEKQIQLNNILRRQSQKCNLSLQMLQKLGHVSQRQPKPQEYYQKVSIEEFTELCSIYQIKLTRYKSIKEQVNKFQTNQKRNEVTKMKREQVIREKKELQGQIIKAQEETRHIEYLKNSLLKLEPLVRMQVKSKQKRGNKGMVQQKSSQQGVYSSVEQAEHSMNTLRVQILQQKVYIQKLQISISHFNDMSLLIQQKERYQQLQQQLQQLTNQLKTSQDVLNNYNSLNTRYERQSQSMKHRLQIILHTLNQPLQQSYLMTLNKIKHLQASISNIQLLYYLMQQAVSSYHSQKMGQINQYIYEVWRQIYHGDDIEYIEIQASSQQGSKKKKKNYQYKILMKKSTKNFKNQQKVQMKGRCSTGQKVLASIVIRLALAEVFCGSTRILALDQPTTNLDREHISNLANALLRLIELSGGKNLQLIIISHDIEFIQMLQSYADSYYEVKRDQNRFSSIQKKYIREILEGGINKSTE